MQPRRSQRLRLNQELNLKRFRTAKLLTAYVLLLSYPMIGMANKAELAGIGFVPNQGQWNETVRFRVDRAGGASFLLDNGELVHQVEGSDQLIRERLINSRWEHSPVGVDARRTRVNYFHGNDPKHWQRALPSYSQLSAPGIYPGIDLSLRLAGAEIEKVFTIAPGASPDQIRLQLDGLTTPTLAKNGTVVGQLGDATQVEISAPIAYQETINGVRESVAVAWRVQDKQLRFELGDYDPTRALVIDPILRTTYFGGSNSDGGNPAIGPNGNPYIIGTTSSTDLPGTAGGFQPQLNSTDSDLFAVRLNPELTEIEQATYIGGGGEDLTLGSGLFASNGDLIIVGSTESIDFPGTNGGAQPAAAVQTAGGSIDAVIVRLSADLSTLVQSTYFGGSGDEQDPLLFVSDAESLYVMGVTTSPDLPATQGGAISIRPTGPADENDLYVVKIPQSLTSFTQATYYGGISEDLFLSAVANDQGIYLSGLTTSTDLPGTAGGAQPALNPSGEFDAFVVLMNSALTAIEQATYYGGSGSEFGAQQLTEAGSNLYLSGVTGSTDLPATAGGAQPNNAGNTNPIVGDDGFVALLQPDLRAITQATYFGGGGPDILFVNGISGGNLLVSGSTSSTNLPGVAGAAQPNFGGGNENPLDIFGDTFVALINPDLRNIVRTTYLGGSNLEAGMATLAPNGDIYVSGITTSPDFPGVAGGFQETFASPVEFGEGDGFVARLSDDLTTLLQASYFGGSGIEIASGLLFGETVDQVYLVGLTLSADLPATAGAAQPNHANTATADLFLSLITPDLTANGGSNGDGTGNPGGPIFGAALPGQRVFSLGGPGVTYFGTIINSGTVDAENCSIQIDDSVPAQFSFQTTDANNAAVGTANTPIDIPAGGSQSFVFTITPTEAFPSTTVGLVYDCENSEPASSFAGVNTVDILSVDGPAPDIIAIALTITDDGIGLLSGPTGTVAVAMATVNVGTVGEVTVQTDTGAVDLGVSVSLCQTNPGNGSCLAPPTSEVTLTYESNDTPTFSFFITGSTPIALNPAVNRLNIRFMQNGDVQVGQSSIALQTAP